MRRSELMKVPSFSPQPAAGKHEVAQLRRLGRGVHVLHDEEVEALQDVVRSRPG